MQRITPQLPARSYDTYQIEAPYSTHYREVDCEDAECRSYANGWQTFIDESDEAGQHRAWYVRNESGRVFTEARNEAGVTVFTFRPGQPCFATHRERIDREENFYRSQGDWRRTFGRPHKYARAEQWVDDFATNQDTLKTQLERG